ncbi:MAG TPA: peptidyl-prolyl cis-trans isomerase [Pyrinomonadaceae bacterium]
MRYFNSAILLIAILFLINLSVAAQETDIKVVDEVVAQVNDSVVTLSGIKRQMKDVVDALIEQGKTREQAEAEVNGKQAELIANVINEEMLLQKGKELGVDSDVEAEINNRFREKMAELNLKSIDKLYEVMRASNIDPDSVRETWRKQLTKDIVLQREVDSKVYYSWTSKEIKDYYEKNKTKFTKPETITLSEIFLSFAGRDEAAVKAKAAEIIKQARGGADFSKLAVDNSERSEAAQSKGKVGTFTLEQIKGISEKLIAPLQTVKVGGVTEPIIMDEGVEILRVDERTAASSESVFDETEVRKAMTYEKIPDERRKYLSTLRQDSYIKISDTYRPMVAPLLSIEEKKIDSKKTDSKKSEDKKSESKKSEDKKSDDKKTEAKKSDKKSDNKKSNK